MDIQKLESIEFNLNTPESVVTAIRFSRLFLILKSIISSNFLEALSEPQTLPNLCKNHQLNQEKVKRTLNFLIRFGLVEVNKENEYRLSKNGRIFAGPNATGKAVMEFAYDDKIISAYSKLNRSLSSKNCAYKIANRTELFDSFQNSDFGKIFPEAMNATSRSIDAKISKYLVEKLPKAATILELGGGTGKLLKMIIEHSPHVEATNIDLVAGKNERNYKHISENFFNIKLPASKAVILKKVIHDWGDNDVVTLLTKVKQETNPDQVFIIETINDIHANKKAMLSKSLMDMEMLIMHGGGRERNLKEFEVMARESGFELTDVHSVCDLYHCITLKKEVL